MYDPTDKSHDTMGLCQAISHKILKKNVDQSQAILVTLLEFGHEIGKTGFKEE